jgi:hypothetical protein
MALKPYKVTCRFCKAVEVIILEEEKVIRWRAGELIQNVFPDLDKETRELLISKTCTACFAKMFGGAE